MYIFVFPHVFFIRFCSPVHAMRSSSRPLAAEQHKFDLDGKEVPSRIPLKKTVSFSLSGVVYFHIFRSRDRFGARLKMM